MSEIITQLKLRITTLTSTVLVTAIQSIVVVRFDSSIPSRKNILGAFNIINQRYFEKISYSWIVHSSVCNTFLTSSVWHRSYGRQGFLTLKLEKMLQYVHNVLDLTYFPPRTVGYASNCSDKNHTTYIFTDFTYCRFFFNTFSNFKI